MNRHPSAGRWDLHRCLASAHYPGARWMAAACLLAFSLPVAFAQAPVVLSNHEAYHALGRHLALLEDRLDTLTIENVTAQALAARFVATDEDVPQIG